MTQHGLVRFWRDWWFSVLMMVVYVALFLFWKAMPSRVAFVAGGLLVAAGLVAVMVLALRRGYFAGRADVVLHGLIIADIVLESIIFEALLPFIRTGTLVPRFHHDNSFYLCAVTFSLIIAVGHYWGLRRRAANAAGGCA
jgi:hypothetical protein